MFNRCAILCLSLACVWSIPDHARADNIDEQTPTFYLTAFGGLSTYESEMVKSTTSSTAAGYGFGSYAGSDRNLGMSVNNELSTYAFTTADIDSGTVTVTWQDFAVKYRWGPVYVGAVLGSTNWKVSRLIDPEDVTTEVEEYMNITASGFGGNLGANIPVGKNSTIYLDIITLTPSELQEAVNEATVVDNQASPDREIALGSRMDIDMGGSFKLMKKLLKGMVGLKRRTVALTVGDESFTEVQTSTYLGLQFGWTF